MSYSVPEYNSNVTHKGIARQTEETKREKKKQNRNFFMSLCNSGTLSNATFNLETGIPLCLPTTVSSHLHVSNKDKTPTNSDYLL